MTVIAQLQRMNHGSQFRAFALRTSDPALIDPFLGVDHAWISGPTFPPHPHAGFSAVSYLFLDSQTAIKNRDSRGTHNLIQPGGLHWTAAGSGVVHEEEPAETGKTVHMLQIFVNLPVEKQEAPPFALTLEPQDVPVLQLVNARVRVPLGRFGSVESPLRTPTEVSLLDITLEPNASINLSEIGRSNAFILPILGSLFIDGESYVAGDGRVPIFPNNETRDALELKAGSEGAKFVFFSGTPLRQPVYWHGPMAFASPEALDNAIKAFHGGEMGGL